MAVGLAVQFLAWNVEVDRLVSVSRAFTVNSPVSSGGSSEQVENPERSITTSSEKTPFLSSLCLLFLCLALLPWLAPSLQCPCHVLTRERAFSTK